MGARRFQVNCFGRQMLCRPHCPGFDMSSVESFTVHSVVSGNSTTWQRELAAAIRSSEELARRLGLLRSDLVRARIAPNDDPRGFPVLVPESFLRRMQRGNPRDPLLLQVLGRQEESTVVPGFQADPVGDAAARRIAGMLQKYQGRALLILAGSCAVHCRYCFRREYAYEDEPRRLDDWEPAFAEMDADSSLSEVIFSGGDPLMLPDARLREFCQRTDAIPHVARIRFHTRMPIVLPSRVTEEWIETMQRLRAQAIVVVHANHAREVAEDCAAALQRLVRAGIPVLNQTVLLRGINDSADALEELSLRLTAVGVMPYYLHQLDRVSGAAHFEVPVEIGRALIAELQRRLPGYAVPRYVQEIPGAPHKSPL